MNRIEFDTELLDRMAASFERVKLYLDKNADKPEEIKRITNVWYRILQDYSLQDALLACDEVMRRSPQPRYLEDIPRVIGAVCAEAARKKRPARKFAGGQQTFGCKRCQDTGIVIVWHTRYDQARTTRTMAVACDLCDRRRDPDMREFKEGHMEVWSLEEETRRMGLDPLAMMARGREIMAGKGLVQAVVDVRAVEPAVAVAELPEPPAHKTEFPDDDIPFSFLLAWTSIGALSFLNA